MAVAVDFSAIPEMSGRIATKYALGERSVLAHKAERQYRSISCSDLQGYGLTETAPVLTANRLDGFKYGEAGKPFPDVDIKIAENGEILA